jgi:hypothetical protein
LRSEIFGYESDDTVDVVVLSPEGSAGKVTDKEFGDEGTETGTDTEKISYY